MGVIFNNFLLDLFALIVTSLLGIFTFFLRKYKYWEKKGVPYLKPIFPFGTLGNPLSDSSSLGVKYQQQYFEAKKRGHKICGLYLFASPAFMITDLDLIKTILIKDFSYFPDRGMYINEKTDPLSTNLFSLEELKWRKLRAKLTPTFTVAKIKMMFNIVHKCGEQLHDAIEDAFVKTKVVNIKDYLLCFTTDIIGCCAFGIDCNSFKNPSSDFQEYTKKIFLMPKTKFFENIFAFSLPSMAKLFGIKINQQDVEDFFINVIKETVNYRKKSGTTRNDFLQLLIDLKNEELEDNLTIEEIAAQSFIFFIAGYDTSATAMMFCVYELCQNPEVQDKLREEMRHVLSENNGEISYEILKQMKYLDQVINETLRKYPTLPMLNRRCVKDYIIPNTNITIEKGVTAIISVLGMHNDSEYFPDPEKFDPERFNEENKTRITPYSYIPFGEGPRTCIGFRFGLMSTRVGLLMLLKDYKVSLNSKTQIPIQMHPQSIPLMVLGDVWINVEKI